MYTDVRNVSLPCLEAPATRLTLPFPLSFTIHSLPLINQKCLSMAPQTSNPRQRSPVSIKQTYPQNKVVEESLMAGEIGEQTGEGLKRRSEW